MDSKSFFFFFLPYYTNTTIWWRTRDKGKERWYEQSMCNFRPPCDFLRLVFLGKNCAKHLIRVCTVSCRCSIFLHRGRVWQRWSSQMDTQHTNIITLSNLEHTIGVTIQKTKKKMLYLGLRAAGNILFFLTRRFVVLSALALERSCFSAVVSMRP
jgi:hypothetical protein